MGSLRTIREGRVRYRAILESSHTSDSMSPGWAKPEQILESQVPNKMAYVDPDRFFRLPGAVVFLYTTDGQMYYGNSQTAHYEIIGNNRELLVSRYDLYDYYRLNGFCVAEGVNPGPIPKSAKVSHLSNDQHDFDFGFDSDHDPTPKPTSAVSSASGFDSESSSAMSGSSGSSEGEPDPRTVAMSFGDLLGRLGQVNQKLVVSFWNTDADDYQQHLQPCIARLIKDKRLTEDAFVSTPLHGTVPIAELADARMKEMTAKDHEDMELYKKLHLMRGNEKKEAMRQLGLGVGGKPHPMAAAMTKAGLLGPGQKWWAPNSEAFERRLEVILGTL